MHCLKGSAAIVAPGLTQPGSVSSRPVSLLNLYPTLIDLCSLPSRSNLEGISLRPLLEDPSTAWDRPAVMTFGRGNHAVRSERYRYIRYANGEEELYDHVNDPEEWTNLAGNPGREDVIARLAEWLPEVDAPGAMRKASFDFDPVSYTWKRKASKEPQ